MITIGYRMCKYSHLLQIGLVTTLITTVVTMSSIAQLWDDEWEMVFISLQVSYLQGCFSKWRKRPHAAFYCIKPCLDVCHLQY